jgi:uncharacterized alpha-E superfamily protein
LSDALLARYAECIFWLARYVERAENLARILDVHETFARDTSGSQNWLSILALNADQERFLEQHSEANAQSVLRFYVTDARNPTSIVSAIDAARENARTLRPLISTEMWVQINIFHKRLHAMGDADLAPGQLPRLFSLVKEACQTHTGITEGTFYRDQGWHFYQMGRYVERADQTTRLLDSKYHLLLPRLADVGSPVDLSQWNALLRSAAGYHAYRRFNAGGVTPARVAGFLLLNTRFPRSVYLCVREIGTVLTELKSRYALRGGNDAAEGLDALRGQLGSLAIETILHQGLHEFLDQIQQQLNAITAELARAFFIGQPVQTKPIMLEHDDKESAPRSGAVAARGRPIAAAMDAVIDPFGDQPAGFLDRGFRVMDAIERGAGAERIHIRGAESAQFAVGGDHGPLAASGNAAGVLRHWLSDPRHRVM